MIETMNVSECIKSMILNNDVEIKSYYEDRFTYHYHMIMLEALAYVSKDYDDIIFIVDEVIARDADNTNMMNYVICHELGHILTKRNMFFTAKRRLEAINNIFMSNRERHYTMICEEYTADSIAKHLMNYFEMKVPDVCQTRLDIMKSQVKEDDLYRIANTYKDIIKLNGVNL